MMRSRGAPLRGLRFAAVHMGVFDFSVHVVVGDLTRALGYARWLYGDPDIRLADDHHPPRGLCFHRPGYCPIVWIPSRPRTPRQFSTVAHEAHHAVSYAMRWAGIEHTAETEEVFAHSLGFLVTRILEIARG